MSYNVIEGVLLKENILVSRKLVLIQYNLPFMANKASNFYSLKHTRSEAFYT